MHRQRNPGSGDDIPVSYITVPPAAAGKMIAMELARFPGLPVPRRANITDVIELACGICPDTRVTMIIVGELHNLDMGTRAGAGASGTLKYFSGRLPATVAYSGIGPGRGALLAGPRGDQVAGRLTLIPAGAFTPGQEWPAHPGESRHPGPAASRRSPSAAGGGWPATRTCGRLPRRAGLCSPGLSNARPTLCHALERHGIQARPCPGCHPAGMSGYSPPATAQGPEPAPLPAPAAPVAGKAPASFPARPPAASRTTPKTPPEILPPWFRVKARWHDDRCQPAHLVP
jgi:hypothetical protein